MGILLVLVGIISIIVIYQYYNQPIIEGLTFSRGTRGQPGPPGTQGDRGLPGQPGDRGPPGPMGPMGSQGTKGDIGPPGSEGPTGRVGPRGERGFDGFPGPPGQAGPRGDRGETGPQGKDGRDGKPGIQGKSGSRGWQGVKGDPGTFAEGSCKFFGSDDLQGWQCPDTYPVYAGGTFGIEGSRSYCNGGLAKNAVCNGSSGSGAKADVYIDGGKIIDVKIVSGGSGYKTPPHVRVVGKSDRPAILRAETMNGSMKRIVIVDSGRGYSSPPELEFEATDSGYGATAEALVDNGCVAAINMVHTGQGYRQTPRIDFRGGGGSGAEATAEVNDGRVTFIKIVKSGSGYTYPPVVVISPGTAKYGCTYCHMCCKRGPKKTPDKNSKVRQYEERIEQNTQDIQNLMGRLETEVSVLKYARPTGPLLMPREEAPTVQVSETPYVRDLPEPPGEVVLSETTRAANKRRYQRELSQHEEYARADMSGRSEIEEMVRDLQDIGKGADVEELEKYRKTITHMSEAEQRARLLVEKERLGIRLRLREWAKDGVARQSSTRENMGASQALDGNLDTFNQTDITSKPSWWQVELPKQAEVVRIVVRNRLGSYNIRNRLPPFKIEIYNRNGALVKFKQFTDVRSEYIWESPRVVGKVVKIVQTDEPNFLHIAGVEVWGFPAQECNVYPDQLADLNEKIKGDTLKGAPDQKDLDLRSSIKGYMESCSKMSSDQAEEQEKLKEVKAEAYTKVMAEAAQVRKEKIEKAKKIYKEMELEMEENQELAIEAEELGLPPPPSKYTPEQVARIRQTAQQGVGLDGMDKEKKARCMSMLHSATEKRNEAVSFGQAALFIPLLIPAARSKGRSSASAWERYNEECG